MLSVETIGNAESFYNDRKISKTGNFMTQVIRLAGLELGVQLKGT
jgi:hypothetical protein